MVASTNGTANGTSHPTSEVASPIPADEEEEPTIPITVTGPQPLAYEAQELINQIIASKTSKTTQRVRDIPAHIVPFVKARYSAFISVAQGGDVQLTLSSVQREVTVSGDREVVIRVIDTIRTTIESVTSSVTPVRILLPKRQHRLLAGKAIDDIMTSSKCSVVIPPSEESSEEVVVWGMGEDIANGLTAAMTKANSQYIHEFPLPGPILLSKQLLTYMVRIDYAKTVAGAHPGVAVFMPDLPLKDKTVLNIDIVGEKSLVDAAVRQVSELMGKLIGATKEASVDWLVHKIIIGKNGKK